MHTKIGFIGAGNMGFAMIKSMTDSGVILPENINVYDTDKNKMEVLTTGVGINALDSALKVVDASDIIFLAIKPNIAKSVLESCKEAFDNKKILVSIVVGIPMKFYADIIGIDKKIVRTMPNTPALVREGMTLICPNKNINSDDIIIIETLLECIGRVEKLDEHLMNEVTAITGSSPAYIFIMIEAMADAAVLSGIPRKLSYKLAAQAILGSAKMVLDTGLHPAELKDQVCSPAGTTIEALTALEANGFRHAIIDAMNKCTIKSKEIGKKYGE